MTGRGCSRPRSKRQNAERTGRHGLKAVVSGVPPAPGPHCLDGPAVPDVHQCDAERGAVVGEQSPLQAPGEVPDVVPVLPAHARRDDDPGDDEEPPGGGAAEQTSTDVPVEARPPWTRAACGEAIGVTGQGGGLRDQQREPRPSCVGREMAQEGATCLVPRPRVTTGGFRVQVAQLLQTVRDLTTRQPMDPICNLGRGRALPLRRAQCAGTRPAPCRPESGDGQGRRGGSTCAVIANPAFGHGRTPPRRRRSPRTAPVPEAVRGVPSVCPPYSRPGPPRRPGGRRHRERRRPSACGRCPAAQAGSRGHRARPGDWQAAGRPAGHGTHGHPHPAYPAERAAVETRRRPPTPSPACVGQRPESWSVRFVLVSRPELRMEQLPRRSRRRDSASCHPRHRARRGTRTLRLATSKSTEHAHAHADEARPGSARPRGSAGVSVPRGRDPGEPQP